PCSDPCRVHLTLPPAPRLLAPFPYTTLFRSSGHIQHIIDPASNPVITVFIATRAISGKISTRISREIGFDKTFRITPDGSHLARDRKSTRLNSSHVKISYAVFCLKKKNGH